MTQAHPTHPTMENIPLDGATGATAGLVSAKLVRTSRTVPPRTELFLVFTDGTRNWEVRLQPTEVKSV